MECTCIMHSFLTTCAQRLSYKVYLYVDFVIIQLWWKINRLCLLGLVLIWFLGLWTQLLATINCLYIRAWQFYLYVFTLIFRCWNYAKVYTCTCIFKNVWPVERMHIFIFQCGTINQVNLYDQFLFLILVLYLGTHE